ncbi:hypothetical protein BGZ99_001065 [Dissophora globulifera]|uniref:Uncharacterized protein n=1 Tax=Dissophora globulifera TaxID=979702 RepID=A0A9P6RQZ1_9FUNG|nr:hypothetical protein BGZ99_001065 [Dissophora globulifera]
MPGFTFTSNLSIDHPKEDRQSLAYFLDKMDRDCWKSVSTIRSTYFFDGIGRGGGFLAIPHLASHGNAKTNVVCRLLEAWLTKKLVEPTISDSIPVLEDNIQSSVQSIESHLKADPRVWAGISQAFIHIRCGHVFMLDTCCDDETIVHLGADEFYQDRLELFAPDYCYPKSTINSLKKLVKDEVTPHFDDIDDDGITFWRVPDDEDDSLITFETVEKSNKLISTLDISNLYRSDGKIVRIIVQASPLAAPANVPNHLLQEPYPSSLSPSEGDLRALVNRIADRFFAPESSAAEFLNSYVQGQQELPVTTSGVCGLPKVVRRGEVKTLESRPNLLFLDLPIPLSTGSPPERFRSNPILAALRKRQQKGTESLELPVFGVSGCGKTRSMIEILCLQWGFYFNAAEKDNGSDDLHRLSKSILSKQLEGDDPTVNTIFAKRMTLVLFLSRLLILKYCLKDTNCRRTFTSASWATLQACPNMFKDVFSELFDELHQNLQHLPFGLDLTPIVDEELLAVRCLLAGHNYPNFSSKSGLLLVVDEAQVLSDMGALSFLSSTQIGNPNELVQMRPMLSPILHGFRGVGGRELKIIYCGTGLSIRTLGWVHISGGYAYDEADFQFIEFPGWTDRDSIQSYIDRVKEHLSDNNSKNVVDALIPPEAVDMLHRKLTGRFRPIITAIERIFSAGHATKWENEINTTEALITSWKDQDCPGNLCGELLQTLGLFLFRYYMLDESEIILTRDVELVESAFGRIKILGGDARTVIDEPFVLTATKNFFWQRDPLLISMAERAMLHSDIASVHGNMWEILMPSIFVQTFKTRPLSSWPLLIKKPLPELLKGDVAIVGYNEQEPRLAISYKRIAMEDFMKAHVQDNSKRGDQDVPPFYFPAPQVSGPDIIFYIRIKGKLIPVFVQLKLRQTLQPNEVEEALETVSGRAVQEKLTKERKKQQKEKITTSAKSRLQDYCPTGVYISMLIAYPANMVRYLDVRPNPGPELDGLTGVPINVDYTNFSQIFPERHAQFLKNLKSKGPREVQHSQGSSKTIIIFIDQMRPSKTTVLRINQRRSSKAKVL